MSECHVCRNHFPQFFFREPKHGHGEIKRMDPPKVQPMTPIVPAQFYPMAFHPLNLFNQAYGAVGAHFGYPTAVNNFGQFLWRKKRSLIEVFTKRLS